MNDIDTGTLWFVIIALGLGSFGLRFEGVLTKNVLLAIISGAATLYGLLWLLG